jgi:3-deoxy-D-manno-octulosonate 8-phosphate phosphatase (KDO 8-P phosphatase)
MLTIEQRAARVKLLLLDCDGVLTDGRVTLRESGDEYKSFHTRDGQGLALWHRAGGRSGIISGRASSTVTRRAAELRIEFTRQGVHDKVAEFREIIAEAGVAAEECAYVGDDLPDIPLMRLCGLAVAVADAAPETRAAAHYITKLKGGRGAVREVTDLVLQAQGLWDELLKPYLE